MAATVKIKMKLNGKHAATFTQKMKKALQDMGVQQEPKGSDKEQGEEN